MQSPDCRDLNTGISPPIFLSAPLESVSINILTTLVVSKMESEQWAHVSAQDFRSESDKLITALGLSANLDFTTFDRFKSSASETDIIRISQITNVIFALCTSSRSEISVSSHSLDLVTFVATYDSLLQEGSSSRVDLTLNTAVTHIVTTWITQLNVWITDFNSQMQGNGHCGNGHSSTCQINKVQISNQVIHSVCTVTAQVNLLFQDVYMGTVQGTSQSDYVKVDILMWSVVSGAITPVVQRTITVVDFNAQFTRQKLIKSVSVVPSQVRGCTDSTAINYNSKATIDDGSCKFKVRGCTNSTAINYNPLATEDDGSCKFPSNDILGCTDPVALNYNSRATKDDGSCKYRAGCTNSRAINYDSAAQHDKGGCLFRYSTALASTALFDGYLYNCVVCLDANGDGMCRNNEPTDTTDGKGRFSIQFQFISTVDSDLTDMSFSSNSSLWKVLQHAVNVSMNATFILLPTDKCVDVNTGVSPTFTLVAPIGSQVLTVFTTLSVAAIESGSVAVHGTDVTDTWFNSMAAVQNALGIPQNISLFSFNKYDTSVDSRTRLYLSILITELINIITLLEVIVSSIFNTAGNLVILTVTSAILTIQQTTSASTSSQVADNGNSNAASSLSVVDLSNESNLQVIVAAVSESLKHVSGKSFSAQMSGVLVTISRDMSRGSQLLMNSTDVEGSFQRLSKISFVIQRAVVEAMKKFYNNQIDENTLLKEYSGDGLNRQVDQAKLPQGGCMNKDAPNYDPNATFDDGSCTKPAAPVNAGNIRGPSVVLGLCLALAAVLLTQKA
jgi:hypothetical protein